MPNAIDSSQFLPLSSRPSPSINASSSSTGRVIIVVVSRLTYRKGVDLLVGLVPIVCAQFPQVDFVIGGDGPKRVALEDMIERHQLQDRVEMLGSLPHSEVPGVLNRGHIFLNCSLTEAFCIAIVEAASCGLLAVSTAVGGVPEVLPADMVELGEPSVQAMAQAVARAIVRVPLVDPQSFHRRVSRMYNWDNIASRIELIYHRILRADNPPFRDRLLRFSECGIFAGKIWCLVVVFFFFTLKLCEYLQPYQTIEPAIDWPRHPPSPRSSSSSSSSAT
ncbi:MAG: glycosyltransferase [archaeon]|nr:glycosyltransferase [archaeon]